MESTNRFQALTWRTVAAIAALAVSACTVDKQEAPSLAGPSGFALSLTVSAAPQVLPRDGSSTSKINMVVREANGQPPKTPQRLRVLATAGSLNVSEVETDASGNASVLFVAPSMNQPVSFVTVDVIPLVDGDLANTNPRSVRIGLLGPDVPLADFAFNPTDATAMDLVSFDASRTTLGGTACLAACTYSWDFADGNSTTGMGVAHPFTTAGVFNVTLTATSIATGTSSSITKPVTIAVPPAPQAALSINPTNPTALVDIVFSSVSVVPPGVSIVRYVWNVDNGGPPIDTGNTPSYTLTGGYAAATTHQVTLTITDNYGRTSRSTPSTIAIP
jgi:PKD repeat protein